MKPITETITKYEAEDGSVHDTEKACLEHEANLKKVTYWVICHSPDLTEGRGMQRMTFLKVFTPFGSSDAKMWVEDYCFRTFGRPVAFAQGVSACPNWSLQTSTIDNYAHYANGSDSRSTVLELKLDILNSHEGYGLT